MLVIGTILKMSKLEVQNHSSKVKTARETYSIFCRIKLSTIHVRVEGSII